MNTKIHDPLNPELATARNVIFSGASALAALVLATCAAAPLSLETGARGETSISWLVPALVLLLIAYAIRVLANPRVDVRVCAFISAAALLHWFVCARLWALPEPSQIASDLSGAFSATFKGVPLLGLLHGWAALCLGFLVGEMVLHALRSLPHLLRSHRFAPSSERLAQSAPLVAWLAGCSVAGFGARAVIGYATGSTSLLS